MEEIAFLIANISTCLIFPQLYFYEYLIKSQASFYKIIMSKVTITGIRDFHWIFESFGPLMPLGILQRLGKIYFMKSQAVIVLLHCL
jgi:hypothetical protein